MIGGWDEGTLARFIEDRIEPLLQRFGGAGRWEVGDVKLAAYATPDAGWLLCDGSAVSRSTYDALFRRVGTTYGAGDGSTTFNVPDFRGRGPIGVGTGDATGATAHALGVKYGEQTHVLSVAEMPNHAHAVHGSYVTVGASAYIAARFDGTQPDVGGIEGTGGGAAHENRGPVVGTNFFIRT